MTGSCLPESNQRKYVECLSDEGLVDQAKRGNESAIVELWRRYGSTVRGRILRVTRNWEDTEDILQETYLKSYIHLDQFDGRARFSTWLVRIAINSALMLLRKRHKKCELLTENGDLDTRSFDFPDEREDIESYLVRAELIEHLWEEVSKLKPALRHIFELQYKHDLSAEDIAELTDLSVPAVKSRLLRARTRLRDSLATLGNGSLSLHQSRTVSSRRSHSRRSKTVSW